MISVSSAVIAKGMMQPTFHVFSETLAPCPSEDTRLFDEFPAWSIEADEVRCERVPHRAMGINCLVAVFFYTTRVLAAVNCWSNGDSSVLDRFIRTPLVTLEPLRFNNLVERL